ncbi:MAG: ferrochelatase [Parachlamydiaceae bacterium]
MSETTAHSRKGVLLVNLGTPKSPAFKDVWRYLIEFLTDPRVIDFPWLKRQLLVRGLIVPLRIRNTMASYKEIWTKQGSPLAIYTENTKKLLQKRLGSDYIVESAMRYPSASCENALDSLLKQPLSELLILPLFPQYASATTGSVFDHITALLKTRQTIPTVRFLSCFHDHPGLIDAFHAQAAPFPLNNYDKVLFSFHGLPVRQLIKADRMNRCGEKDCCSKAQPNPDLCYAAQCHSTGHALAKKLSLPQDCYEITFQSRLGKEPWLTPFTVDRIQALAKGGAKRLLIFCPAFVADCLETLYEIQIEYNELFQKAGGEKIDLVPSLNDSPKWIDLLEELVKN